MAMIDSPFGVDSEKINGDVIDDAEKVIRDGCLLLYYVTGKLTCMIQETNLLKQ